MRVDLGEVIVPVLSNTIQSILAIFSTTAVFLIYILFRSKMLNAAESVKGELSANAHGHAMINTAVNAFHALAVSPPNRDRKSTRLNSSHVKISYAVFCL